MKSKSVLWILIAVMIFVAGIVIRYINTGIVTAGTILESLAFTLAFSLVYFIQIKK
ncbi:hypothetical protein VSK91_14445 [Bacillus swezeyi]|uniref:hypothetical protein n=1 Tax=Bacillus swezeyi TaxID=1925020 RepID=UPI00165349CD|nr:hypothetical protein [Bacillus swezeyi]